MKKLLILLAVAVAMTGYAQGPEEAPTGKTNERDSLDIPVFIVDGVEVRDLAGIDADDIVSATVTKDPAITKIFSPRRGGVMLITTKSKKFLKPIVEEYDSLTAERRKARIPGRLLIR